MAKIKSTPNLPNSSRMQMPSGGGAVKTTKGISGKAASAVKKAGVSKGVLGGNKKVMPKKPY